jgi:hypothetical protein
MRTGKLVLSVLVGWAIWPSLRRLFTAAPDSRPTDIGTSAAVHHSDPAARLDAGLYGATRDAGPASMRDDSGRRWDHVDQASDESFPASDPPATY